MDDKLHAQATKEQPSIAPTLEITKGEDKGKIFEVKMTTRLGRERDNDITLIDPKISRYHAQITLDKGQWLLADLGSSNQTYLNGEPLTTPQPLQPGDRIEVGEIELTFKSAATHSDSTLAFGNARPTPAGSAAARQAVPTRPPLVQTKSDGPSRLLLIAGAFVILLCVATAVAVFMISRLGGAETEVVAGDSSGTVVADNTGGEAGAGATNPGELPLVYEDDFSDPFSGWDDAFDTSTTKQYGNNRYQVEVNTANLIAWGLANRDVADFEVEVEAKQEGGGEVNSYGLLFRFQDRNNFYRFDISGDGFFLVSKFADGAWTTLVDWTASPHISPETNLIGVSAFGPEITVKVNGQALTTLSDDSLTHGNFGFFASTFNNDYMWVSFDNLKLWTPPEQEIALIPTATRASVVSAPAAVETTPSVADNLQETSEAGELAEEVEQLPATAETELASEEDEVITTAEAEEANEVTPTPKATTTPEATPTPVPLPEYASRDQPLGRGEELVTGRIIFPIYDPERGTYDLYLAAAADGANRELVQEEASQPALNEDGSQVAYRSWKADQRGLFARPLSGGTPWGFDLFFESARPQFSPLDDSLIYFSRSGGREPALYQVVDGVGQVMRRDGAPIQGQSPKLGSEGQQFVYSSCIGGKCGIILGHREGSLRQLTDNPADINPEISPDGHNVVFMSERSGDWDIYIIDIAGQNLAALTDNQDSDGLPTWSPDGTKIGFVSNHDGEWAMWDMDPDGSNKRRLFVLGGSVDGLVQHDLANSRGWLEENIDWGP